MIQQLLARTKKQLSGLDANSVVNNKKTIDQSGWKSHYKNFPKGWQWEKFIVQDLGNGKFCLRSIFNTYVRANQNGWMDQSGVTKEKTLPKQSACVFFRNSI